MQNVGALKESLQQKLAKIFESGMCTSVGCEPLPRNVRFLATRDPAFLQDVLQYKKEFYDRIIRFSWEVPLLREKLN